jgi:hypothetical protein
MSAAVELFDSIEPTTCGGVVVGSGETLPVLGQGSVSLRTIGGVVRLSGVQFCPALHVNLISIKQLDRRGCSTLFQQGRVLVRNSAGETVMTGTLCDRPGIPDDLYVLDGVPIPHTGALDPDL